MIDHFPSADQRLPANDTTEESPKKILEAAGNEYKRAYRLLLALDPGLAEATQDQGTINQRIRRARIGNRAANFRHP